MGMREILEQVQADIDRLRSTFEPEMSERQIRFVRSSEIPNINVEASRFGVNDRIAEFVTSIAGSILFAYFLITAAGIWVTYNVIMDLRGVAPLDRPWEFPVMLLISNGIQLMMPIFIMVSQKRLERRDQIRADRDYLMMLIGKRDVLLMFSYLDEVSRAQRGFSEQMKVNQSKMLAMEQTQRQFDEVLAPKFIGLLAGLEATLSDRPCILRDLDEELASRIIEVLSGGPNDGSEVDAQDPAGGQGREPVVGMEDADEGPVGKSR